MTVPISGDGGFGMSPSVPPAPLDPLAGLKPPLYVWIAVGLLVTAGVLSVVNAFLGIGTVKQVANMTDAVTVYDTSRVSAAYVDDFADGVSMFLVIVSLVAFACYLLLAFQVRAGRRWARTVCTVLAVLSLFGLLGPPVIWVVVLAGIAAVVLLWLPTSRAYFDVRRMARVSPSFPPPTPAGGPTTDPDAFRF